MKNDISLFLFTILEDFPERFSQFWDARSAAIDDYTIREGDIGADIILAQNDEELSFAWEMPLTL